MKVKVLSLLVPALLVAGAANAAEIYTFHGVLYTFHPGTLKPVTRIKSQGHTVNDAGNSVITLYTALSH